MVIITIILQMRKLRPQRQMDLPKIAESVLVLRVSSSPGLRILRVRGASSEHVQGILPQGAQRGLWPGVRTFCGDVCGKECTGACLGKKCLVLLSDFQRAP